ncbi:MAG TPA: hypothetical protein VGS20_10660 [Candidatus Acidoferrales bacterium]|nr:hypothetical protein [Candidatus Acidoferrales bacterium]
MTAKGDGVRLASIGWRKAGRRWCAPILWLLATAAASGGVRLEGQAAPGARWGAARAAGVRAPAGAQEEKFAPAHTTLERILSRYTRELGGMAAWRKATSIVSRGECQFEGSNLAGTALLYQRPPNRMAFILNLPGVGVSQMVIDGVHGWQSNPRQPVRALHGAELEQYLWNADFYHEVRLRTQFRAMKLLGIANLDGPRVYVIDALPRAGKLQRLYFEVSSGLLARVDVMLPNGSPSIVYYADYRNFRGLVIPVVQHMVTPEYTMTIRWTSVEVNRPMSESVFKMPVERR